MSKVNGYSDLMPGHSLTFHGRKGTLDAIAQLDLAINSLYPHTDFYKISHKIVSAATCGHLKTV
jgi:hypothetical protein